MKYYNWQQIHKNNHFARPAKTSKEYNFNLEGLSEAQKAAWQELQKYWRPGQLTKLLSLAKTYDRASDSFGFQV